MKFAWAPQGKLFVTAGYVLECVFWELSGAAGRCVTPAGLFGQVLQTNANLTNANLEL